MDTGSGSTTTLIYNFVHKMGVSMEMRCDDVCLLRERFRLEGEFMPNNRQLKLAGLKTQCAGASGCCRLYIEGRTEVDLRISIPLPDFRLGDWSIKAYFKLADCSSADREDIFTGPEGTLKGSHQDIRYAKWNIPLFLSSRTGIQDINMYVSPSLPSCNDVS
jgi:hypothetical protein